MARQTPFYNPMSFASELNEAGYLPGPSGQTRPPVNAKPDPRTYPPTRPPVAARPNQHLTAHANYKPPTYTKPGQTRPPVHTRPPVSTRPPVYSKPKPKPGDKATVAQQRLAGQAGKYMGGRTPVFAKGFQYGPRTQRGGPTPVVSPNDWATRIKMRESNKYIGSRLTPFVPRRG